MQDEVISTAPSTVTVPVAERSEKISPALIKQLRARQVTGPALRYMRTGAGFTQEQFLAACKDFRSEKTGKLVTKRNSVTVNESKMRVRQLYATVMERMIGKAEYEKWLVTIWRERPKLLPEATTRRVR